MMSMLRKASPSITKMIRMDHTYVLAAFHRFERGAPTRVKKGLADSICLALEIHAQLEEEIFYPALRAVADDDVLRKSKPEHDQMRMLIAQLRQLQPGNPTFDHTLYELMRLVIHHVADEETQLLPKAELLLPGRLQELGAQMTRRRLTLAGGRAGELAGSLVSSVRPATLLTAAGAVLAGGVYLLARRSRPAPVASLWKPRRRTFSLLR